jgi:hypothetical protein
LRAHRAHLKASERVPDTADVESQDTPAHRPHEPSHAEAAFGAPATAASPRASGGPRLALLLGCLLAAVIALLCVRGAWFGLGGAQARETLFAAGCPGAHAREVASVARRALPALRGQLSAIVPRPLGRPYEAGSITTSHLWTDDEPQPPPSRSTVPAGYEIRWWALDRDGSEDDVAADVLEFATPAQARNALALAASARCRTDASAGPVRFPAGASELHWVNPDTAQQWDVLFSRGRRLYRVGDVPPEYLITSAGPRHDALERARDETTPQALACALPEAGCPATAPTIGDTSLATLAAGSAANARAPTEQQASAYAGAVNIRGYQVPGMSQLAPEGPVDDRASWEAFARCARAPTSSRSVLLRRSPVFTHASQGQYEVAYSVVAVEPSSAEAARYLRTVSTPRVRECIARAYEQRLLERGLDAAGSLRATQVALTSPVASTASHAYRVTVTAQATPTPTSYRGSGPYRATALQLALQIAYRTRRGHHARVAFYFQDFAFADGPSVVELSTVTLGHPYPQASQRFLEGLLVGRAEANQSLL